jgi:hypothetical protein
MTDKPANSPKPQSLDEIVSQSAVVIAEQIRNAASWAKSEMDLQVEVAGILKDFARQAKIDLSQGHHNVTIATGRPDSVYGSVIIEYKEPGTLSPAKDAAPNRAVVEQLKRRFYDMNREEHRNWRSMFGVGTDGKYFIFLRFRDDKWTDQEPLEANRYSTERFLWALYNLGQKGKPYQPEYLHGDFGSESTVAQEGVRALYEQILATQNPKAQVFFNQWKILFGEVCGYDVENLSDKLKKLAEFYVVKGKPQPAPLLFAVHTYYAILIKLLAAEIVSFFNPWMPRQVEKLQSATTPAKLKRELEELERGGIFHQMGITNFLEGDLFSWYLAVWSEPIQALARKMISKLDEYNPGTFSEEPAQSRDLLKKLYQQLFPKSVRHDLGEYYTPDWLAEHVLNELGYEGDPDKRLLDPACGSGTFLVMAINRIRRWYDQNREKCTYDEGELLKKILANVIGFDLNPLAVMAARTNYLVAIKDLIRHVEGVEIPVYLCDSIMTPAEYGDLFAGAGKVARVPCSAMKPPNLLVPKEIARSPREVAKYAHVLEECVKNAYSSDEFLSRCREEGLDITATDAHIALYKQLVRLDRENKNGIWARIIKNNFAPLFVGRVDYVAGNPPWVNWENLPEEYRQSTAPLWHNYNLFPHKGYKAKLGGAKDDISILMTYVAHDCYLSEGGRLGFVITQSVFKTKGGGEGFRGFRYAGEKGDWFLTVKSVQDLSNLQPFEGATNRTAAFVVGKSRSPFRYPVPYVTWHKATGGEISPDDSLREVLRRTRRVALRAQPVNSQDTSSPWLTASGEALSGIEKVLGRSDYRAYAGCCTWLNGVFWVGIVKEFPDGRLLIANLNVVGKIKQRLVHAQVEPDLVYPLLRGRDVLRWRADPSAYIILANRTDKLGGIPESEMKRKYPKTFAYFAKFEDQLRRRSGFKQYFNPGDPFYSMYNVGPYTMAKWKVMWPEVGNTVRAGVCGPRKVDSEKPALPDHTIIAVPCGSGEEAHYVCALINSSPARSAASGYIVLHPSPHIMEHIGIRTFDPNNRTHTRLSDLSKGCHAAAAKGDAKQLAALEAEMDKAAANLWGITADELKAIQEALAETSRSKRPATEDEED